MLWHQKQGQKTSKVLPKSKWEESLIAGVEPRNSRNLRPKCPLGVKDKGLPDIKGAEIAAEIAEITKIKAEKTTKGVITEAIIKGKGVIIISGIGSNHSVVISIKSSNQIINQI